ncbi:hypothetical protein AB0M47_02495 [Hamadaea sp. NPDC051192]|uniref:hypothetical protein n=1 Tax=Hamadaea sp. NPDC051192 TaxID=3154940 RepID=UPI003448BCCF
MSTAGWTLPRVATVGGLVVGAAGIATLWAAGVAFPFAVPPGMIILLAGAIFVTLARWRWAPGLGAGLGLFVTVGFLISPSGLSNLSGDAGTPIAVGQAVQLVGVITAFLAGVVATAAAYRKHAGVH